MKKTLVTALFLTLGTAQATLADGIKPGLWEISSNTSLNGQAMPNMEDAMAKMNASMEKMTPEARAQMQAMMAKQGVGIKVNALQVCISPERAAKGDIPTHEDKKCNSTVAEQGKDLIRMTFTCENPPSSGESETRLISDSQWHSRITVHRQEKGQQQDIHMENDGKWVSSDCGNIKPH